MKKQKKKGLAKWDNFQRAHFYKEHALMGGSYEVYTNSRYQVTVDRFLDDEGNTGAMWLSFKHHDKRPVVPWRDKQRIKNELCGPEAEGVELFPAESRLVDTANQYHLWVLPPGTDLGMGYKQREIMSASHAHQYNSKQAAFQGHHNSDGCTENGLCGWGPPPETVTWLVGDEVAETVPYSVWVEEREKYAKKHGGDPIRFGQAAGDDISEEG